jgi:hypothetical protein
MVRHHFWKVKIHHPAVKLFTGFIRPFGGRLFISCVSGSRGTGPTLRPVVYSSLVKEPISESSYSSRFHTGTSARIFQTRLCYCRKTAEMS